MQTTRRNLSTALSIRMIQLYRNTLSPWMLHSCRFSPTCSEYALQALERFGILRGSWLTVRRLGRCHPFGGWGFDPVK